MLFVVAFASTALPAPASAAPPRTAPLTIDWSLAPDAIVASCATQISTGKQRIDALVHSRAKRTFNSVFLALENLEDDVTENLGAQTFLYNVSEDPLVRDASQNCSNDVSNFFDEESARPDLFHAMLAAENSRTARGAAQLKLQQLYVIGARRSGGALSPAKRKEFVALEKSINDLEQRYQANLSNDPSAIAITAEQAASLPPDFTGNLKKDASGNLIVPVNESTYGTFYASENSGDARKAFYMAYQRRGGQANVDLLQQALAARSRVAILLGYPTWAAYIAADTMAQTPQRIATFLHDLDVALLPQGRTQFAELATVKGAPLDQWDVRYYQNQIRKSRYSVDRNLIKQYFPAPHVISAVLDIYSKMLGLTFTLVPNLQPWNATVTAYDVTDTAGGDYRGRFYLDLYPRPGKFEHFENYGVIARRVLPDGSVRPVINTILGNWPAPADGKPSLLSRDDVEAFFHEFGHNVAALCANTPYATLNSGFRRDFIEAPSQMLENFVWDGTILKQISSEVDTGAPLPDDLIAKLQASRYFDEAYDQLTQVAFATIDQRYHTLPPPVDTTAVWKQSITELTPNHYVEGTIPQAAFGHLMNGYEAGYYGYLWSKVFAQDMFTAFVAGGLESPVVGARYRADILAPARLLEPDVELRNFLGRPVSPEPFYHELGITSPK
jgi:thimet oligopeptidase